MQLNKNQKALVDKVIDGWQHAELIPEDLSIKLKEFDTVRAIDWAKISKYSFWLAIVSLIIALGSLFADKWIISMITYIFKAPKLALSGLFALLAAGTFYFGVGFERKHPQKTFTIAFLHLLGAVFLGFAFVYLIEIYEKNSYKISSIFALSTISYALLGYHFRSVPLWILALCSLVACFGSFTDEWTRSGHYFLGMNFPLRFTVLATLLYLASFLLRRSSILQHFEPSSQLFSLLLLFFFLWILSISGNTPDYDTWEKTKQINLLFWGVLALILSFLAAYRGFKTQDNRLQVIGFVFILLNMYTRFIEYFWNSMHKAFFFAVLGISFWLIGTKAEKYWRKEWK
jgi:hypothetical protein